MKKRVYIKTFGCQMNENDSAQMLSLLEEEDFISTSDPEEADLIIVNTCSVREKSYHKAISEIGRYSKKESGVRIGVTGCVASQEGRRLSERFHFVDFVLGTDHIDKISQVAHYQRRQTGAFLATDLQEIAEYHFPHVDVSAGEQIVKAYVTIMKGCDNTCAFCIVPLTRGAEISRPSRKIIEEIHGLEKRGVREVTLLGQNVNSYGKGLLEQVDFPKLLEMIARQTSIARLRFTSPHPKDLSLRLVKEYRNNSVLCRHIHLPVQSGSSRILKRMRRAHTRDTYLKRVEALRAACPEVAITTDLMVGFPGETDKDFEETLSLMSEVQYDAAYSFAYSERPGTEAARWKDDVPAEIKSERLQALQSLQREISRNRNQRLVGQTVAVLVEGYSKANGTSLPSYHDAVDHAGKANTCANQLLGRTSTNHVVNFDGRPSDIGVIVEIKITRTSPYALYGDKIDGIRQ